MMNSQSVPKASFAPHESDHVWSQRECQAWPSRPNFAHQSRQITDDLFHVRHNGFTSIIRALEVLRNETRTYPEAPKTQRAEKSVRLQLGFRHKITMFSVASHKWCLHSSIGLRIHGRVCGGGANLHLSLCFTGASSSVCFSEGMRSHSRGNFSSLLSFQTHLHHTVSDVLQ